MSAAKYRKKPVVIEAMQWDGTTTGATPVIDWILSSGGTARFHAYQPPTLSKGKVVRDEVPAAIVIDTLEGSMFATRDDFIIKGVQGEFYPCKPDIFEATYESAN